MRPHTARIVCLHERIDVGGFERTFGDLRLDLGVERSNDDELVLLHAPSLVWRPVTLEEFEATLTDASPPDVPPLLLALWWDARGDWERAHSIAQDIETDDASLVHAYLHRKEGDLANAGYWYRRARRPLANDSLEEEWRRIVSEMVL